MSRLRNRLGALLLFATVSLSAQEFGPVRVLVLPSLTSCGIAGYCERRFEIINPTADPHEVVLTVAAPGYRMRAEVHVSRKFVAPPRTTIDVAIDELILGWSPPRQLTVTVDGRDRKPVVTLPTDSSDRGTKILLSRTFPDTRMRVEVQKDGALPDSYEFVRTEVPVQQWSTNWLAYSSYMAMAVTAGDWNDMPAPAQAAVLRWMRAGGTLLIAGGNITGGNVTAPEGRMLDTDREFTRYNVGWGGLMVVPGDIDHVSELVFSRFARMCERSVDVTRLGEAPMMTLPLLGRSKVPVGVMFTMLLAFAVFGGPVSLVMLARRDRRLWIFWTLPLLALVAGAGIIATSLLGEGWQRVHRSSSITFLDENRAEASTLGITGVYSTLPPDGQLRFSADTELRPYEREPSVREVDVTDGQRLLSGWVDSRVSTYFAFRRSEHRRERLSLQQNGVVVGAVNGFGARIVKLWVADEKGKIYEADDVEPGAQVTLHEAKVTLAPEPDVMPGPPETWPSWGERLRNDPRAMLRAGMYVAVLQSSPFVDAALERPMTDTNPGVVVGIAKWSVHDAI